MSRAIKGIDLLNQYNFQSGTGPRALQVGDDVLIEQDPLNPDPLLHNSHFVGTVTGLLTNNMVRVLVPNLKHTLNVANGNSYVKRVVYVGPKGEHCDMYDRSKNPSFPDYIMWDGLNVVNAGNVASNAGALGCGKFPLRTKMTGVIKGQVPGGAPFPVNWIGGPPGIGTGEQIRYEPADPRVLSLNAKDLRQYMMDRKMLVRDPMSGKLYPIDLLREILSNQIKQDRINLIEQHQTTINTCDDNIMRAKVACADYYKKCENIEKNAPNPRLHLTKSGYNKAALQHAKRVQQCKQTRSTCFNDADLFLQSPKSLQLKTALLKDLECLGKSTRETMHQCRAVAEMQEDRQFFAGPACVLPMKQVADKYIRMNA